MRNLLIPLKKTVKINLQNPTLKLKSIKALAIFLSVALIGGSFLWVKSESPDFSSLGSFNTFSDNNKIDLISFEKHLKNLPISKTSFYEASNEWATAILIPQYHRYPGSDAQDSVNDSALRAQEQIYQILSQISKQYNIKLVMVEGELYGPVSSQKINGVEDKINECDKLIAESSELKKHFSENGVSSQEQKLIKKIDKTIAKIERNIILEGAPFKLKAEGQKLTLFGSENKDTQDQSRALVKKYIYLQDREKELNGQSRKISSGNNRSNKLFSDNVKSLLEKLRNSGNSLIAELNNFKSLAELNNDQESIKIIEEMLETTKNLEQIGKNTKQGANSASREDNPYKNIKNSKKIKEMIDDTEEQINNIVVDQRNKETAQNFSLMLKDENQTTGILQYGAGHEQGLIKELNEQGISVIVVTPEETSKKSLNQS